MRTDPEEGVALLEVLVALAILATAAMGLVQVLVQSAQAVEHARSVERERREANAFMEAVSLWPRPVLDLRLGTRGHGAFALHIERIRPDLYEATLYASDGRQLLGTALYRPEARDAEAVR